MIDFQLGVKQLGAYLSSYSLFEKKFVSDYQFMKVERKGSEKVYCIDWKDCNRPVKAVLHPQT